MYDPNPDFDMSAKKSKSIHFVTIQFVIPVLSYSENTAIEAVLQDQDNMTTNQLNTVLMQHTEENFVGYDVTVASASEIHEDELEPWLECVPYGDEENITIQEYLGLVSEEEEEEETYEDFEDYEVR